MKTSITPAERLRIVALIADAKQLLIGMDDLSERIARALVIDPDTIEHEAITDTCFGAGSADDLLQRLNIRVEEPPA